MRKEQPTDFELVLKMQTEARRNSGFRRDRGLFEYRGYDFHLDLNIPQLAQSIIEKKRVFKWYDMCCGTFEAGKELMISDKPVLDLSKVRARGIDLDTKIPGDEILFDGALVISQGNVVTYPLPNDLDLITDVEGLYLVDRYMGFSAVIQVVERWYNALSVGGMMAMVRGNYLHGVGCNFNIVDFLKQHTQDVQVIEQLRQGSHPDFHYCVKLIKLTPNQIQFPQIEYKDVRVEPDLYDAWIKFNN